MILFFFDTILIDLKTKKEIVPIYYNLLTF